MDYAIRNSIKVILLNPLNELLLMCIDDPDTKPIGGEYRGRFWTLIGGRIEAGETALEAAAREVFEETGIIRKDIAFGPLVWYGEHDLVLYGTPTHIKQQFIVAKTNRRTLSLANLTQDEAAVVDRLAWFSLDQIAHSDDPIYPVLLLSYLPEVLAGKYPDEPFEIDLTIEAKS